MLNRSNTVSLEDENNLNEIILIGFILKVKKDFPLFDVHDSSGKGGRKAGRRKKRRTGLSSCFLSFRLSF